MAGAGASDLSSQVAVLTCWAGLLTPLSQLVAMRTALKTGQCRYPRFTISDVIRVSPGANIVAAGWMVMIGVYTHTVYGHINRLLGKAAPHVGRDAPALARWARVRGWLTLVVVASMAAIQVFPLQIRPRGEPTPDPGDAAAIRRSKRSAKLRAWLNVAHFSLAGAYAAGAMVEAAVMLRKVVPILLRHRLVRESELRWMRLVGSFAWPGWWVAVVGTMVVGRARRSRQLEAAAAVTEFGLITIYGCYPVAVISFIKGLERSLLRAARSR